MGKLFWLTAVSCEAWAEQAMEFSPQRKRLLSRIERLMSGLVKQGQGLLDTPIDEALTRDLLYLICLSGSRLASVVQVHTHFGSQPLLYNDRDLQKERESLKGPSASTLSSVASVLKDELNSTKEILETASQGGLSSREDLDDLVDTLQKIADILAVMGLISPGHALKQEIVKIEAWRDSGDNADAKDLLDLADSLLYVESSVSSLEKHSLSDGNLQQANSSEQHEVIAFTQLEEAQGIVLKECESALAMIKRALNSFAESGFDRNHINNVAASLNSVRGGMAMLHLQRAAAVLQSCCKFMEETLLTPEAPAAMQQILETFADAIIGIEYYLDAVKQDSQADDSVLELAEESLQALGFPVALVSPDV